MSKEFDKEYGQIKVATSKAKLSSLINNILKNKQLREISLIKKYLTTALDAMKYLISA